MSVTTPETPMPLRLLRDHLRSDAPIRERSAARFMASAAVACMVLSVAIGPFVGWRLILGIIEILAVIALYYVILYRALHHGWYHPLVAWANSFIEVSIVVPVFYLDAMYQGAQYALTSPPIVVWSALVMLSALRVNPVLSISAGVLAALECWGLYVLVIYPRMPADPLITLTPPLMAVRAVLLFCSGVLAAVMARHLLRKSEEALRAVRQQDLMGKYFLHEQIGRGGMAEVYRATYSPEGGFEKIVAIKRVLPRYAESADFTEMFREEARICALLNHPNIVQVFDIGRFEDSYILAMEYVEGISLHKLIKLCGEPLPLQVITYLAGELGEALDYIHRRTDSEGHLLNLVHRDVNPPNILVSRLGEVKLADFGVARAALRTTATNPGHVRGKVSYMAPEQLRLEKFDGRADLFTLGLTLREALTGDVLYSGESASSIRKQMEAPITPPSRRRPDVPPELDAVIMDLLRFDQSKRIQRGRDLQTRVAAMTGPLAPQPDGPRLLAALTRKVQAIVASGARGLDMTTELSTVGWVPRALSGSPQNKR